MAGYISGDTRKVTTHRLVEMKQSNSYTRKGTKVLT